MTAVSANAGTLSLSVSDITANDALVTVVPDGVDNYFFTFQEKEIYDANGGDEGAIAARIKIWENYGVMYDCPWTDFIATKQGEKTYRADDFITLEAGVAYVAYAFGIEKDGTITSPVASISFTPMAVQQVDMTFTMEVTSVVTDSEGTCTVTAFVTPSADAPYAVLCQNANIVNFYDFNDPESVKQYMTNQFNPYVKDTYTGAKELTFTRMPYNSDLYLVAAGFNGAPTTDPTLLPFKSLPVTTEKLFKLAVTDVTSTDAHITVIPPDDKVNYMWGVATKGLVERAGGLDGLYEYHDKAWWEFVAEVTETTWQEVAAREENHGNKDGLYSALVDDTLDWDTEYVLYAYTLNDDYAPASEVYSVEFKTLPANKSDLKFELTLLSCVPDTDPTREGYNKATVRVVPSNDTDSWGTHIMDCYYYDFYVDNPDFTMDDFLKNQVYPYIFSTRTGTQELTYVNIDPKVEYVVVALGYDQTPTTDDFALLRFKGIEYNSVAETAADNVIVAGYDGRIYIDGDFTEASIYSADGRLQTNVNGKTSVAAAPGMYIVTVKSAGKTTSHKVMVR